MSVCTCVVWISTSYKVFWHWFLMKGLAFCNNILCAAMLRSWLARPVPPVFMSMANTMISKRRVMHTFMGCSGSAPQPGARSRSSRLYPSSSVLRML